MNNQSHSFFSKGQTVMIATIMFLFVGLIIILGATAPMNRESQIVREVFGSKRTFATLEAAEEDIAYRIREAKPYSASETLTLNNVSAVTTTTDNPITGRREVATVATDPAGYVRKRFVELVRGDVVSFNYGVQTGNGGFYMYNSSSVTGNVYANGIIKGADNTIRGDVVSAGSAGLIEDIYATGTARAHTIKSSLIDRDAYYQVIQSTTVRGSSYPGSTDEPPEEFPISEETLNEWEDAAASTSVHTTPCPYVITASTTLGNVKIDCDLEIRNNPTITLSGTVWVSGNIEFKNSPTIKVLPSLGARSVAMIADNRSNRLTSSQVILRNSTTFQGSGTQGSHVMMVSRNRSAADGGSVAAIEFLQTVAGAVLVYTNYGLVDIGNSSELSELIGYKINMRNSAELTYEQGLESSLFDTGPGGSWDFYSSAETE